MERFHDIEDVTVCVSQHVTIHSPQDAAVCHSTCTLRPTVGCCGSPWAAAGPHVPRRTPRAAACPTCCGVPHVPWSARFLMTNLISNKYRIDERAAHAAACARAAACRGVPRRAAACRGVSCRVVSCRGKLWCAVASSPLSSNLLCRETYPPKEVVAWAVLSAGRNSYLGDKVILFTLNYVYDE